MNVNGDVLTVIFQHRPLHHHMIHSLLQKENHEKLNQVICSIKEDAETEKDDVHGKQIKKNAYQIIN